MGTSCDFVVDVRRYDKDNSDSIDLEEMSFVLGDLGLLNNIRPSQVGSFIKREFEKADTDGNGVLSFEEFTHYYNSVRRLGRAGGCGRGREKQTRI